MSRILLALLLCSFTVRAQTQTAHPTWPGKGQLFVGTCYQPVDRSPEEIKRDIALMKAAGFRMVRVGDLAWDSIEPSEGDFQFALYDSVMERMNQAHHEQVRPVSQTAGKFDLRATPSVLALRYLEMQSPVFIGPGVGRIKRVH
jgi:hypothetical protein